MKRFFALILILTIVTIPVSAKNCVNVNASMQTPFEVFEHVPEEVIFVNKKDIIIPDIVEIPANATVKAELYQYREEKRWHKSGFFICKPIKYTFEGETSDISDSEFYLIARKYESPDYCDTAITTAEIIGSTAVSMFLPGVDILYFFTKGAIQRKNHSNWFKAGVSNAWDNSIFWFPQKGKDINLAEGDIINLRYIKDKKAEKLSEKINKQRGKQIDKAENKLAKELLKQEKKQVKEQRKLEKKKSKEIF